MKKTIFLVMAVVLSFCLSSCLSVIGTVTNIRHPEINHPVHEETLSDKIPALISGLEENYGSYFYDIL